MVVAPKSRKLSTSLGAVGRRHRADAWDMLVSLDSIRERLIKAGASPVSRNLVISVLGIPLGVYSQG